MRKLKLLVVDDDAAFAKIIENIAVGVGMDVILTDDSREFASLYTDDLDIVVLDVFMPEIDGIELLRFLSSKNAQASIVLMSGGDKGILHSVQELAIERNLTVLGALQKPFSVNDLEDVFAKHISRSQPNVSNLAPMPTMADLQRAIEHGELFVDYQPQVTMEDASVVGVEALVRWRHPTMGVIPPNLFIPMAEEGDLIEAISMIVSKIAINQQSQWRQAGLDLCMSINISPKNLSDLDLPEKMMDCALENGGQIDRIMFELTETALLSDVTGSIDVLSRLRMKNFKLSIDDFGTGYSSLQQLVRVPFTELKIDQSFVQKIVSDEECKTIAEISILLAHKLEMNVVAEGVEHEEEWETLKEMGCDIGQGYWVGRPMPADDLTAWIADWHSRGISV